MDASSFKVFEAISHLRPRSILDVVRPECFRELGELGYSHIGNGNCFEWKYAIAKYLQPISILEIGVRYGYSMCAFIEGSDAIETVEGWDSEIYVPGSNDVAREAVRHCGHRPKVKLIRKDSALADSIGGKFDLVHIDSSHHYETCLRDLRLCHGSARAVLVDDTMTCPDDARAVRDFCDEHKATIRELLHIHSHVGESLILFH
jgi:predicted O-methyltransferase YrrM